MRDADCVSFLQWALPRLGLRWPGYRKVRRQVCKRIGRRLRQLGLEDLAAYRRLLIENPDEWRSLDDLCRITISRFARDRRVFEELATRVVPQLARRALSNGQTEIDIWSAGCAAGEEAYSLVILAASHGDPRLSRFSLRILATDADAHQIERARTAVYPASSLRELDPETRERAFAPIESGDFRLSEPYRSAVEFRCQDLRSEMPAGPFHLILCRNLAFTYFDAEQQSTVLEGLEQRLAEGGCLVVGSHETLPGSASHLTPNPRMPCLFEYGTPRAATVPDSEPGE